tara:strand:- start:2318 stop:3853 length:1536 start_codon:yes stop_codon:yes gene_type:complete
MKVVAPKFALISLSDKTNLELLVTFLLEQDVEIVSTGGTYKAIKKITDKVIEVSEYTGHEEMMDGRIKTLHPKIHAGILARRGEDTDLIKSMDYREIDVVVANLYPFEETIKSGCSFEEAIEQIDIGGPTMIRAAAKNFNDVLVLSDPDDYEEMIDEWNSNNGISYEFRKKQATKVFKKMSQYNKAIHEFMSPENEENITIDLSNPKVLRYGENPHQKAKLYLNESSNKKNIANAEVLQGKELSYNNIADSDAAWECLKQFSKPACVIVKHANPCGVSESENIESSYRKAFQTDPTSAFGGIIAINRTLESDLAEEILDNQFVEVLIAPKFTNDALNVLEKKENIRVLRCDLNGDKIGNQFKVVSGGVLVQDEDTKTVSIDDLKVVSNLKPSQNQLDDFMFAWRVAKFVKSNAIVFAKDGQTIGIGAGQMSRVVSAEIASLKAKEEGLNVEGSCMASDAFFPFRDGIDKASSSGIKSIIQPGGSVRDQEVIDAVNEHKMVMVFTGVRHFRH